MLSTMIAVRASAVPLLLSLTHSSHVFHQRRVPPPCACDGAGDDPWRVLGVPTSATRQEIKTAFRSRAQLLHPDVSDRPDAAARFQELVAAFKLLQDETVRADWHSRSVRSQRSVFRSEPSAAKAQSHLPILTRAPFAPVRWIEPDVFSASVASWKVIGGCLLFASTVVG